MDRKWIDLEQEALVKQVYAANPKTVVVLVSSFPFAINWTEQNVPAILHITHNAQEEGSAIAEVLFGDYNPGGRLVQTFAKSLDQVPAKMDYDIRHGRTYMYFQGDPLYPFGYGLSYTNVPVFQVTDKRRDNCAPEARSRSAWMLLTRVSGRAMRWCSFMCSISTPTWSGQTKS